MKFFTAYKSKFIEQFEITHQQNIVLLGSCFSDNMKSYFLEAGFNCFSNPFGVIYNPISLAALLKKISSEEVFLENEIIDSHSNYSSFLTHTSFNFENKIELNTALNAIGQKMRVKNQKSTFIITLGSAWVYKLKSTGLICANCHKLRQSHFEKHLLGLDEITQSLKVLEDIIKSFNPANKVIFTVSPVRHLKDGFIENQRSKAILYTAIQAHCDKYKGSYFPAYEIMMDELRDYRFYEEDLIHPNKMAIKFIWNHFAETYFTAETQTINKNAHQYFQLKNHKILSKQDGAALKHRDDVSKYKKNLLETYPFLNLEQ